MFEIKYMIDPVSVEAPFSMENFSAETKDEAYKIFHKILYETDDLFYLTLDEVVSQSKVTELETLDYEDIGKVRDAMDQFVHSLPELEDV